MTKAITRRGALATLAAASAAACAEKPEAPRYLGQVRFAHGVASGDPGIDRVVIWTRVTPQTEGPVPVRWIVARNRALTEVVQSDVFTTTPERDYTVKIDVQGLRAGAPYFYGFRAGDQDSPVGRTRTLPEGRLNRLTLAVASCASHPHGFFNAYEAIAQREDVDIVVHLGDYIYEYGLSGFGGDAGVALGRIPQPDVECLSLADYRQRHAQYKAEPELQAAHAAHPWIVAWDDHETANDSWYGGAENHQQSEGAWADRKAAALQAYFEWMPIRDPDPGKPREAIYRSFQFGDLATLAMLETRLMTRSKPLDYATELPVYQTPWDFTSPNAPRAIAPAPSYGPNVRVLPLPYEEINGELKPVFDWARVQAALQSPANPPEGLRFIPDLARLNAALNDPARAMLGAGQWTWLSETLSQSKNQGVIWQVIGNQTLMAPITAPNLSGAPREAIEAAERAQAGAARLMQMTRFPLPLSTDSWDGYPAQRTRLLALFRQLGLNALVLTGDSHAAWANTLNAGDARAAIELGATSITSPSPGDLFAQAGVDFAAAVQARNPAVSWTDQTQRGFLALTLERRQAKAEFIAVSTVATKDYQTTRAQAFVIAADADGGVGPLSPLTISE
ncbi:MAG: alkaline phosphatase D family protein [Hyphomonadaceae bacterium]|nr:alkaline phosphatase D family protein [Hyphomonadaceae bacterium]